MNNTCRTCAKRVYPAYVIKCVVISTLIVFLSSCGEITYTRIGVIEKAEFINHSAWSGTNRKVLINGSWLRTHHNWVPGEVIYRSNYGTLWTEAQTK